jgi:outer membrane receptor for ferrienterochelin and colicin
MDNADKAFLTGIELEFRKNLGFINPMLDNFKFATNFTYTYSRVNLTDREYQANKTINPDAKSWRPFQAQSPFIFNMNLSYVNVPRRIEAAIFSNMFGRRQYFNGFGGSPDVYEIYGKNKNAIPTPDLGFTFSKGITERFTVAVKGSNLFNYSVVRNVEFKGKYYTTESFRPGTTISVSLRYAL